MKARLDLHGLGIDHRNRAWSVSLPGRRPLERFDKISRSSDSTRTARGRWWPSGCPSCRQTRASQRLYRLFRGRDEGDEGRRSSAGLAIMIRLSSDRNRVRRLWLSLPDRDRVRARPPGNVFMAPVCRIHDPDLPRAVSNPKLRAVVGGQHAVGTGGVVVASEARESRVGELLSSLQGSSDRRRRSPCCCGQPRSTC